MVEPYLQRLRHLAGIIDVHAERPTGPDGDRGIDALLSLDTSAGPVRLAAVEYRSHLSHQVVDQFLAARHSAADHPILVLAPHIGAPLGAKLASAGLNYLDRQGNCHIAVGSLLLHVEGQKGPPHHGADKGVRSAGYQVLFAYLADPRLIDAPVREVAEQAGVSRQPVSDMRRRLLADEFVLKTSKGILWHRKQDALNLWLHGYETMVRPSLMWGAYRTAKPDPEELERELAALFDETGSELRWGGTAAGYRLTKYYRGERTTVHVRAMPPDLPRRLRALPDPGGNLVVMDAFGTLNWHPGPETVHPLLVYSEMLQGRDDRAREAAQELFEQHIRPTWEAAP